MLYKHSFLVDLNWPEEVTNPDQNDTKVSAKNHTISITGKEGLKVSAAKAFKGDPTKYNPEDLLLSSLTSCHMMSYLYVCQKNKIQVRSYSDHAEAILEVNSDGSGRITKVILRPTVTIPPTADINLAQSLHKEASKLCFIANSCNFEIVYEPKILVDQSSNSISSQV